MSLGVGCGGDDDDGGGSNADDGTAGDDGTSDGGDDGADDGADGGISGDPTDPALFTTPKGEEIAFGVQAGNFRNYFHRQGTSAVHLVTRSGAAPRIVAGFPANNQGIGIWFEAAADDTQLWAGADDESDLAAGGGLLAVTRSGAEDARAMNGARATLHSNATSLTAYLSVLANVRTVRDFGYGLCLENRSQFPELRNETIELAPDQNAVVIRREQIGGDYAMEFLIKGGEGTTLAVKDEQVAPREACAASAGDEAETVVEISGDGGIDFDVIALADDEPLTPIARADLLEEQPPDSFEFDALAFLSYAEKLQAGSWRFLTYFGRDTLLSTRMLMPGLKSPIVDAALRAVLERINLTAGLVDSNFGFPIEVGDVAHEEELGDFAAWKNMMEGRPDDELREPRFDYKMVDDDFLLAPVMVEFFDKLTAEDPDGAEEAIATFLAQTRADGASFQQAIEANLALVLDRARPFADDPRPNKMKKSLLVALKDNVPVGQWRDSDQGIAFGRRAFDVNAALVPGALEGAVTLYDRLGLADQSAEAARILARWRKVEELFRIDTSLARVKANVKSYARAVGVADTSSSLEPEPDRGKMYTYYGIALDGANKPLPVMHTDHGLVMEFAKPSALYLQRTARSISKPFPAGLMSPVGVMVANPALANPETMVTDPKVPSDPADDVQVPLRSIYTNSHYHGTVVWSWQQAMLASGLRRQIERDDLDEATVTALEQAECVVWQTISAAEKVRAGELWSWEPNAAGQPEYRPFGFNLSDVDESNAVQLWSTVYLVVKPPTAEQNPVCGGGPTP
ncbi:MAG TPA: hypothetical protein VKB80_19170 [Kofleriaceae bacterium]|nr:hypothetical protein [Kofleriaceae bacterium]